MSLDFSDILTSKARFRTLQVLYEHNTPLPLRHISYLNALPIRSAELALHGLHDLQLVYKVKKNHYSFYFLNRSHPAYSVLSILFGLIQKEKIHQKSKNYTSKAPSTLSFMSSSLEIIQNAKKMRT